MDGEEEYVQLQSWAELIEWLEREGYKAMEREGYTVTSNWNPKPKRKKKGPPQSEGLF